MQPKSSIRKIVNSRGGKEWAVITPWGVAVPLASFADCVGVFDLIEGDISFFVCYEKHEYCRAVVHA